MFLKLLKPILRACVCYAFRPELKGTHRTPGHGKMLIIANHPAMQHLLSTVWHAPSTATICRR